MPRCPQSPDRPPPVRPCWLYNTGRRTPVHPCDTACRTANRSDSQAIPSLWPVTPPALPGFDGRTGPVRHPQQPGPTLAGLRLDAFVRHLRTSRVAHPLCTRVPPSLSRRTDRLHPSLTSPAVPAFPQVPTGSASAAPFSGPAQRSLLVAARVLAKSPSGDLLHRRLRSLRYLHDRSDCYRLERQSAGWVYLPLRGRTFSRRTELQARSLRAGRRPRFGPRCRTDILFRTTYSWRYRFGHRARAYQSPNTRRAGRAACSHRGARSQSERH